MEAKESTRSGSELGTALADGRFQVCPFQIVVDSNEQAPYSFTTLKTRKSEGGKPLLINTVRKAMWSMGRSEHGIGLADYSIDGWEDRIQIERKSLEDLFSTLGSRRDDFEKQIERMNRQCEFAAVVIEGSWPGLLLWNEGQGRGPTASSVFGTVMAWQQRYRGVHWMMMHSRGIAELWVFRALERFWRDQQDK